MIYPGEVHIKDMSVLRSIMERRFAPILIDITSFITQKYGIYITEGYRDKRHPNDLHGTQPVRAIDLRYWCYPDYIALKIQEQVNLIWVYDPSRPDMQVALIHDSGEGKHFHIQVHPNTRKR